MKAVVFRQSKGLVVEDVPVPELEPDQVLIEVVNTGFCGSDHSLIEAGVMPDGAILGHEVSGIVVKLSPDVEGPSVGDRVIVRPTFCGECPDCLSGLQHFCNVSRRTIGLGDLSGGYAEYIKAYQQMLIKIPDGVDSRNAALCEPIATTLHAIELTRNHGGPALVIGGGPIGLSQVKMLKIFGYEMIVLSEPVESKREVGKAMGADVVVDPFSDDLGRYTFECTDGRGFQSVFECSGEPGNIQAGLDAAAKRGMVCLVSMISGQVPLSAVTFNWKEVWLTGSWANTHEDNIRCLQLMAEGKLDGRPMISDIISLDALPTVYRERIHTGQGIKVMAQIGEEF